MNEERTIKTQYQHKLSPKSCKNGLGGKFTYVAWHNWAEEKSKTHKQRLCKKCQHYHVWEKKNAINKV